MLLDYILTLMGRDDEDGFADSNLELLHTQVGFHLVVGICHAIYLSLMAYGQKPCECLKELQFNCVLYLEFSL